MTVTQHEGRTPSGTRYLITIPEQWNETLLLYCRGLPVAPDELPWDPAEPLFESLTNAGYAVAGSGGSIFWPLEDAFKNQRAVLDEFGHAVGEPARTIPFGYSIGGIIAAGLVEVFPERLAGALPLCGNLAGAVAVHNRELDIAFVIKTLLAKDTLEIARIRDPRANLDLAQAVVQEARTEPAGRARLALAAAVGNIPAWFDPRAPMPPANDFDARLEQQLLWYDEPVVLVLFFLRAQVEQQAGGNPSWNYGVDYSELLRTSINRDDVEALYAVAGLDLDRDLAALAAAPRIEADPQAVEYLERHVAFSGDLAGIPVLTLHTSGDGLVTPDNEEAYRSVVEAKGQGDLLRQLYVDRGGHCTFTVAEVVVALEALLHRVESGSWPSLEAASLNRAAAASPSPGVLMRGGAPAPPAFFDFEPWRFPRPHDTRGT